MHFLQVMQSPVMVQLPAFGKRPASILRIPKFTIDQIVAWGAEIEQANVDRVTQGLDEIRRREYMTMYPPSSPDLNELRRLIITPPGIKRIVGDCLQKAEVFTLDAQGKSGAPQDPLSGDEIETLIKANGTGRFANLTQELADLTDRSQQMIPRPSDNKPNEERVDPLTSPGNAGTNASSTTGPTTLPSLSAPTRNAELATAR